MTPPATTGPATWPAGLALPEILVPYQAGRLQLGTAEALEKEVGDHYSLTPRMNDQPYDFANLLVAVWTGRRDIVIVEDGLIPPDHAVRSLQECTEDWCVYHYPTNGERPDHGIGFTRFSATLQLCYPALARDAGRTSICDEQCNIPYGLLGQAYERELIRHRVSRHHHGDAQRSSGDRG